MTSREAKDYFKETIKIDQLISQYVKLRRVGAGFTGLCPFHNEKTPSFHVSPSRAAFKCFGCGIGGDIFTFVQEYYKLSFPEAIKWFGKQYNVEIEDRILTDQEKELYKKLEAVKLFNDFATEFYRHQLTNDAINEYGKVYAIDYTVATRYNIGYCNGNEKDALTIAAKKAMFNDEVILSSGLVQRTEDGQLHDVINVEAFVIPIEGRANKRLSFVIQPIEGNQHIIKSVVYDSTKSVFGTETNKKDIRIKDRCVLTSSLTDLFALNRAGIHNVATNFGESFTPFQLKTITDSTQYVTICYPNNADSYTKIYNTLTQLLESGIKGKVINLPQGTLYQYATEHNADEILHLIDKQAISFTQFICEHHAIVGTEDDNVIIREVCTLLKKLPAMEQQLYAHELAQLLGINDSQITQQLQ